MRGFSRALVPHGWPGLPAHFELPRASFSGVLFRDKVLLGTRQADSWSACALSVKIVLGTVAFNCVDLRLWSFLSRPIVLVRRVDACPFVHFF